MGHNQLQTKSRVLRYAEKGDDIFIVLDKNTFYAEAGGQVGDTGRLSNDDVTLTVVDTLKVFDMTVHRCNLKSGLVSPEILANLDAVVDSEPV